MKCEFPVCPACGAAVHTDEFEMLFVRPGYSRVQFECGLALKQDKTTHAITVVSECSIENPYRVIIELREKLSRHDAESETK